MSIQFKPFKYLYLLLIFSFLTCQMAYGQRNEIRGFVYDKETGEPIIFTNVYFEGTSIGVATDINGFYSISKVPAGSYTLITSYIGYDTIRIQFTIHASEIITQNMYLKQGAIQLKEYVISDKKVENTTQVKVSKIRITPSDIIKLPTIGSTPDLAQYIQVLPGVVTSGDKGGQIYIRGGTPIMNKVMLDGMTIYNPFHSIGLFSVFDVDIIRNIDVYGGGFDSEFGDRISAVMDIYTVEGNKTRLSGKIGVSPFASRLILSGPIKKFRENDGNANFLFSARSSYLDRSSQYFYRYADSNGLPYSFDDFYAKITMNTNEGSSLKVFGFKFSDKVNYEGITTYNWNSAGAGTQFLLIPHGSSTLIQGHFSYSDYRIDQLESDAKPRYSSIGGFEGGMTFSYYIANDLLRYGFELSGYKTQFEYYNAAGRRIGDPDNTTNLSGFVKYKKIIKGLILMPGIRFQYYASLQEASFEPRFGAKYNVNEWLRFKLATGLYSQNFISAFSDRDVVNLFYGFLSAPDEIPRTFNGKKLNSRLQKAIHYIVGSEVDLGKYSSLNIEAYYKDFTQLTNINRNKIFDNIAKFQDKPEYLRSDYIIEIGDAYGLNFHYIFDFKPFYIWAVYDLAFVNRYDGLIYYTPHWDRRHNIQLLANVILTKKNPIEFSVRWNYGSSFPFTQTQAFFEFLDFSGGINEDYTQTNGQLGILYAELNQGRLPVYHRLDVSLKKLWNINKYHSIELLLSVANVYNRKNIFYFDRVKTTRINQLPVLPSAGITWSF